MIIRECSDFHIFVSSDKYIAFPAIMGVSLEAYRSRIGSFICTKCAKPKESYKNASKRYQNRTKPDFKLFFLILFLMTGSLHMSEENLNHPSGSFSQPTGRLATFSQYVNQSCVNHPSGSFLHPTGRLATFSQYLNKSCVNFPGGSFLHRNDNRSVW